MSTVADRLHEARERIAAACRRSGREGFPVRVVAASKTQPPAAIAAAIAAGVDAIGENRVQEAAGKRAEVPDTVLWHLIGPLQRNKARRAVELFDVIETVDRIELADSLDRLAAEAGRVLPVLVEVNVGGEEQKSGVRPDGLERLAEHVLASCPALRLTGLMTVPPFDPDAERSRPHFRALAAAAARLEQTLGTARLELSMGMSEDYPVAVEEGATVVRLGRALFGARR